MFNNCKHIRSKDNANYERVVELKTGYHLIYDGTRIITSGLYNDLSTTQYAGFIQSIDSSLNVYTHNAGSNYAHVLLVEHSGIFFTGANLDVPTYDSGYSSHFWNNSYVWQNAHNVASNSLLQGLMKSTSYIWGVRQDKGGNTIIYSYNPTSSTLVNTNTFAGALLRSQVNNGSVCYNNNKLYMDRVISTYYRPAYIVISGSTVGSLTNITISEITSEHLYIIGVTNNKALYVTSTGKIVIIDCITDTYTYLGTVASSFNLVGSVIGSDIYIAENVGTNKIYKFNMLDNSYTTLSKFLNSHVYGFCQGFGGSIYCIDRDNITKQHYLAKIN